VLSQVTSDYMSLFQVMTGMPGKSGYVMIGQVRSGNFMLRMVTSG